MTKKRKIILASIGALLVLTIGYRNYRANHQPKKYETATATKGSLIQTVDATGKITSENGVSLRFEVSGALSAVNVREGQPVKKGAVLANLRLAELNAAVAQAQANLNLKLAPSTDQDIAYYKAAVDSAKAALEQVENGSSLLVSQAYDSLSASLSATAPKLDDALTQADNIVAYDNSLANESFRTALSVLDPNQLGMASAQYPVAKSAIKAFKDKVSLLAPGASEASVDEVTTLAFNAVQQTSLLLNKVSDVLRASSPQGSLTQTSLDTKKTTIEIGFKCLQVLIVKFFHHQIVALP
jgi:multidrug efflux pump subunit AcrA (membrane-fusion protein)